MTSCGRSAVALVLPAIVGLLWCSSATAAGPTIASVAFAGDASNPQVTVSGTGFGGEPAATNLGYQGYTGYNYGTALYLCDSSPNPATFCAGYNGDTIGLVISQYSDTAIQFSLGSDYSQSYYPNGIFRMQAGDSFTISVKGATCSGSVTYSAAPISCSSENGGATKPPPRKHRPHRALRRPQNCPRHVSSPICRAVTKTVARKAANFMVSVQLTKHVAQLFGTGGEAEELKGAGLVNFAKRAASWTVTLPEVFNGDLKVVAIGNAPQFSAGNRGRAWVELRTAADYATFDRLPLLRDIVVLTNPLRSLDVLHSARAATHAHRGRAARTSAAHVHARSSVSPSLTTSCNSQAQTVASADSANAKHLTDTFSIGTKAQQDTLQAWASSKVSAEADSSGVCEVSISVENASAEGYDVKVDFSKSTPRDATVHRPQATATAQWETVYHVKLAPCLDGVWETTEHPPYISSQPGVSGSINVTSKAIISGHAITWSRDAGFLINQPTEKFEPVPPYTPYYVPDLVTSVSNYDSATGTMTGVETLGAGTFSTDVIGPQIDSVQDSLGTYPPGNVFIETLVRPLTLSLNCAAGELTVEQYRTLTVGPPLSATLHKTSPTPPPQVTVEHNWRTQISAPL
jgi:hypothetical protein